VRIGPPTGFCVAVVFWDEAHKAVARLVRSGTGRSGVVMCTIDAGDSVGALVEGVLSPCSAAIVARWRRIWTRVRRVVRAYLDGGNGVGKIPPSRWSRCVLGGRNVVPNACILPCESRSIAT
jgi:hypothetical protein